jgi:hypothetical protein
MRRGFILLFEETADREAIHNRHHHIQQNQIWRVAPDFLQSFLAVAGADRFVAKVCQFLLEIIDVERLIIDNQNLRPHRHQSPAGFASK